MSRSAKIYVAGVVAVAILLFGQAVTLSTPSQQTYTLLAVLTLLSSVAYLARLLIPQIDVWHINLVFLFAGVLLMPARTFIWLAILPQVVDWVKSILQEEVEDRHWSILPFTVATYAIAGFSARWIFTTIAAVPSNLTTLQSLAAGTAAGVVFVIVHHFLIGQLLDFSGASSWRQSGVLSRENLFTALTFPIVGYTVALLWTLNPWLIVIALLPLILVSRSLTIPQLKREAQTDFKTGLFNARHWRTSLQAEIERAGRFQRPLSLIMADLDHLRTINNFYGHLAGDIVLKSIADIISENCREYDVICRFGGEEFAIALPEVGLTEAGMIAERLRQAIAETDFVVRTNPTPIRATMSFGVATFPQDGDTVDGLIHHADLALYQSKLNGRDRVTQTTDLPFSVVLDTPVTTHTALLDADEEADRLEESKGIVGSLFPKNQFRPQGEGDTGENFEFVRAQDDVRNWQLWVFWVAIVGAAIVISIFGVQDASRIVFVNLLFFAVLTVVIEFFQLDIYGTTNTVSVGMALLPAAAFSIGLPGVIVVSAAMAAVHFVQRQPMFHKSIFNWAMHVISGALYVLIPTLLSRSGNILEQPEQLILLTLVTLAAALIHFFLETGLIAVAMGLSSKDIDIGVTWNEQFRWLLFHYIALSAVGLYMAVTFTTYGMVGTLVFCLPLAMMYLVQKQYLEFTRNSVLEHRRMNDELGYANREVNAASQAIRQLNDELFNTLAKIIDARDPDVHGHAERVANLATAIARQLRLPDEVTEQVRQAGLLHDIGKIGISEEILHKPGPLTSSEFEIIKSHTTLGGDLLETSKGLRHLSPYVRHHHERWDGSGYPRGLKGDQIPLGARILAVCDAVEAMAETRPYQDSVPKKFIVAEVSRCAGTQFDPDVVDAIVRVLSADLIEETNGVAQSVAVQATQTEF